MTTLSGVEKASVSDKAVIKLPYMKYSLLTKYARRFIFQAAIMLAGIYRLAALLQAENHRVKPNNQKGS